MIKLIINADDFGMSKIFNQKILELLRKDFIKSTTVMVNRITKDQDNQIKQLIELKNSKKISVGLHVDFDITKSIRPQIKEQHQKFISIFGFSPSHLDIHKLIKYKKLIVELNKFAEEKILPVRNHEIKANVKQTNYPAFMPAKFDINEIIDFLRNMKKDNSYELIVHPGEYDPECDSTLNEKRKIEYENIIRLQDFLKAREEIKNISYLEL